MSNLLKPWEKKILLDIIYIQNEKDIQLVKSEDTDKILEKFEPETECKNCHFCYKGNPFFSNFRACMLQEKVLNEEVKGCYGGYRLKEDKHEN